MFLRDRMIWDLSLEEIEYVYRHLHMNHYIYAALQTYYTSSPPCDRPVFLRPETVPPYLCSITEKLLRCSPAIGRDDPSRVGAEIILCTHILQTALRQVRLEDLPVILQLLATCAYIPLRADRCANVPLWKEPVVRAKDDSVIHNLARLLEPTVKVADIASQINAVNIDNLCGFVLQAMRSVIICMENGDAPPLIERALLNTEQAMRTYEHDHGLADSGSYLGVRDPKQIRYRNTLYLYGGMFFERQGWKDRAVDWYLKDINHPALPEFLRWRHLTAFKTMERLMSAYRLTTDTRAKTDLQDRIHRGFVAALEVAAAYSRMCLEYIESCPSGHERGTGTFLDGKAELFWGTEDKTRELFLIALLYNKFILATDYRDIEYTRFLRY